MLPWLGATALILCLLTAGCALSIGVTNSPSPPDACIGSSRTSPCP